MNLIKRISNIINPIYNILKEPYTYIYFLGEYKKFGVFSSFFNYKIHLYDYNQGRIETILISFADVEIVEKARKIINDYHPRIIQIVGLSELKDNPSKLIGFSRFLNDILEISDLIPHQIIFNKVNKMTLAAIIFMEKESPNIENIPSDIREYYRNNIHRFFESKSIAYKDKYYTKNLYKQYSNEDLEERTTIESIHYNNGIRNKKYIVSNYINLHL